MSSISAAVAAAHFHSQATTPLTEWLWLTNCGIQLSSCSVLLHYSTILCRQFHRLHLCTAHSDVGARSAPLVSGLSSAKHLFPCLPLLNAYSPSQSVQYYCNIVVCFIPQSFENIRRLYRYFSWVRLSTFEFGYGHGNLYVIFWQSFIS